MRVMNPKELGQFARQARVARNLTQACLARKTGTTQTWVSEFERGKPRAEIGLTLRLLRALDVTVDLRGEADKAFSSKSDPNPQADDGWQNDIDIDSIAGR